MDGQKEKSKMKVNSWLENKDFISRMNFDDKYYMTVLCKHLAEYIKVIPVPIMTTWDYKSVSIYFHVGMVKKFFVIDTDIAYPDYITIVNRWLRNFFPRYEIEHEVDSELSDEEIMEHVKKGMKLDDALLLRKIIKKKEVGIIQQVSITNDEFILNVDGKEFVRMSGTIQNAKGVSVFLKEIREIQDEQNKKDYIFENSVEVKLNDTDKEISINYSDKMMYNFFIINYPDLMLEKFVAEYGNVYRWGKYKISFNTESVKRDCILYLKNKREQDKIEIADSLLV